MYVCITCTNIPIIIDVHIIMFLVIEGANVDLEAQQSSENQNTNTLAMQEII